MNPNDVYAFISISGNIEIGNGYGVPGGGAYYDAPKLNATTGNIPKLFESCCFPPFNMAICLNFVASGTVEQVAIHSVSLNLNLIEVQSRNPGLKNCRSTSSRN